MRVELKVAGRPMVVVNNQEGQQVAFSSRCLVKSEACHGIVVIEDVCRRLKGVRTVLEMFGGGGWHTAVIQDLVRPKKHTVLEREADCCASIYSSPATNAATWPLRLKQTDSHDFIRRCEDVYDWIDCDFYRYSWHRQETTKEFRGVVDNIFRCARKYVSITDSAIFGFRWPKNRKSYVDSIGMDPDDPLTYYDCVNEIYQNRYGFGIEFCHTWDKAACIYLLRRGYIGRFKVRDEMRLASMEVTKEARR